MKTFWVLTRREVGAYFISPVAYIIMVVFLAVSGLTFWAGVKFMTVIQPQPITLSGIFWWPSFMSALFSPLLTMRLLAEEKNRGTIEMLMTAPVGDVAVVLSKFFAALLFYVVLLIPTTFYLYYLSNFMSLDPGEIAGTYLSLILMMGALMSIGIFVSSLCANQVSAGVITLVINLLLIFTFIVGENIPQDSFLKDLVAYLNLMGHTEALMRGVLDTRDVVLFFSLIVLFLFWTVRVVESRRWK